MVFCSVSDFRYHPEIKACHRFSALYDFVAGSRSAVDLYSASHRYPLCQHYLPSSSLNSSLSFLLWEGVQ